MPKLIDRLVTKIDAIRERVNVNKVGVRPFSLFRVIRTWDGDEVGDGSSSIAELEITPAPVITLGKSRDALIGRGRVEVGSMTASQISLTYTQSDLMPTLTRNQELYYRLVELNDHEQASTYWTIQASPEVDRCETTSGDVQWIMNFTRAQIEE